MRPLLVAALLFTLLPLTACRDKAVKGYGVKGPLAFAQVKAWKLDPAAADLKGELLDVGATDSSARTVNLTIPDSTQGSIVLEFIATPVTRDLNTGAAPLLDRLCTVVDAQRVKDDETLFATPLTTLAVDVARESADVDGDGTVTAAELDTALADASTLVTSTLGFGLLAGVDIFNTPALLTPETTTPEAQEAVARYRTASEALAAVVADLLGQADTGEADAVLEGLVQDLSDSVLDGQADGVAVAAFAGVADPVAVVTQDPAGLLVPGTSIAVGDVETLLASETSETDVSVPTQDLLDGSVSVSPAPAAPVPDSDGDGVANVADTCPSIFNPSQQPALWGSFAWGAGCWQ